MTRRHSQIIIIEDDLAMRTLLKDFFEFQGHRVHDFRTVPPALHFLKSNGPAQDVDLIVSGVHMPGMDGFDLLRAIKPASSVPVILISGFGGITVERLARQEGAFGYLNKPFQLSELSSLVQQALSLPTETTG